VEIAIERQVGLTVGASAVVALADEHSKLRVVASALCAQAIETAGRLLPEELEKKRYESPSDDAPDLLRYAYAEAGLRNVDPVFARGMSWARLREWIERSHDGWPIISKFAHQLEEFQEWQEATYIEILANRKLYLPYQRALLRHARGRSS
jgi:hypothetical protein